METLYHQTNKLVQEVQCDFGKLQTAPFESISVVENEIQTKIDHIISNVERLSLLVNKEPPTRRSSAKIKVDQLKYDCQHLQVALRQIQHKRYVREEEDKEREALLTTTFTANDDTSILMDASVQHHSRLQNAHQGLDDAIGSSTGILQNLRDQRSTLKGVHRKILDIANTLGLSNTVMRIIERRTTQDKIIFWVGVVVTLIVMYLIWKYFS